MSHKISDIKPTQNIKGGGFFLGARGIAETSGVSDLLSRQDKRIIITAEMIVFI